MYNICVMHIVLSKAPTYSMWECSDINSTPVMYKYTRQFMLFGVNALLAINYLFVWY